MEVEQKSITPSSTETLSIVQLWQRNGKVLEKQNISIETLVGDVTRLRLHSKNKYLSR